MPKPFEYFIYAINALSLFLLILCFSVFTPTFNKSFYSKEYDKYNIPESIHVAKGDLLTVTDKLIGYMKDKEKNLDIAVKVNNVDREFFNQKEKDHMVDVKYLIQNGINIYKISWIAFLFTMIFVIIRKSYNAYAKTVLYIISSLLTATAILSATIAINFEKAFTIFHELFFTNDLWLLDPATDLLINIVPLGFFMDISLFIISIFAILNTVIILACIFYNKKTTLKLGG